MRSEDLDAITPEVQAKKEALLVALGYDLDAIPSDTNIVVCHEIGTWLEIDTGADEDRVVHLAEMTTEQKSALNALTYPAVYS